MPTSRAFAVSIAGGLILLAGCAASPSRWRSASLTVPVHTPDGSIIELVGRVCRPATDGKAPVVVINHGSPPRARDRPFETLADCDDPAPAWFLARGVVVVQGLRRGYGGSGGDWAESYRRGAAPDFYTAGLQTAVDIDAAVHAATALPYVDPKRLVVLGQSAGAWGVLAYDSLAPSGIGAFIAMAPGRGGHRDNVPGSNCAPDRLVDAAGRFGSTARQDVLWVNTSNDSYFDPARVSRMQHAFTSSGGTLTPVHLAAFDDEGHALFFGTGGSDVWGPVISAYLNRRHVLDLATRDGDSKKYL